MSTVEVEGVPRVSEIPVCQPTENGLDVLLVSYVPGLFVGATFIGRVRHATEGVKAWPFIWRTYAVDEKAMTLHPDHDTAVAWLMEAAKTAQQTAMLSEFADHAQGGTDA